MELNPKKDTLFYVKECLIAQMTRPDQTCLGAFMYVWFDMCIYPGKQKREKNPGLAQESPHSDLISLRLWDYMGSVLLAAQRCADKRVFDCVCCAWLSYLSVESSRLLPLSPSTLVQLFFSGVFIRLLFFALEIPLYFNTTACTQIPENTFTLQVDNCTHACMLSESTWHRTANALQHLSKKCFGLFCIAWLICKHRVYSWALCSTFQV